MSAVYLVGTRHGLQVRKPPGKLRDDASDAAIDEFECYIENTVKNLEIKAVAEEMSEDALRGCGEGSVSVAASLCKRFKIRHEFCDPDREQRKTLNHRERLNHVGFDQQAYQAMADRAFVNSHGRSHYTANELYERELFWLEKIKQLLPICPLILFICGSEHSETFENILACSVIGVHVLAKDWAAPNHGFDD